MIGCQTFQISDTVLDSHLTVSVHLPKLNNKTTDSRNSVPSIISLPTNSVLLIAETTTRFVRAMSNPNNVNMFGTKKKQVLIPEFVS